jgi:hypothetical protein
MAPTDLARLGGSVWRNGLSDFKKFLLSLASWIAFVRLWYTYKSCSSSEPLFDEWHWGWILILSEDGQSAQEFVYRWGRSRPRRSFPRLGFSFSWRADRRLVVPVFSLIETGYRVILVALLVALRRDDKGTRRTVSVLLKDRSAVMRKAVGLFFFSQIFQLICKCKWKGFSFSRIFLGDSNQ